MTAVKVVSIQDCPSSNDPAATHVDQPLMKTAAYSIAYNEINRVERWIQNTSCYDYRVVVDTGSTDGTYERLREVPGIILTQERREPFRFDYHKNLSLSMVPADADWCINLDIDEWFSTNLLESLARAERSHPDMSALTMSRLDLNTVPVLIGPPKDLAMLRVHRPGHFEWRHAVWECLNHTGQGTGLEIYDPEVYHIHDQDITKPRTGLYLEIMQRVFRENPRDCWNSWFLLNHYYRERNMLDYIPVALAYVVNHPDMSDTRWSEVRTDLVQIAQFAPDLDPETRRQILSVVNQRNG
jgi:glycosyltransferase involved in cell wall biosynthesis